MKRFYFVILLGGIMAVFPAPTVWAQDDLVKQKAMQIRDKNNQQQNAIANAAGPAPGAPAPVVSSFSTPAMPPINPEQAKLVNHLVTDCAAIKPGGAVTPEQLTNLTADLTALSKVSTKPTQDALKKLSSDLAAVLAQKSVPIHDLQILSAEINAVMNSSTIKGAIAQGYVLKADAMLKADGCNAPAVQAVTVDLTGIVTKLQLDKPKLYQ